MKLSRKTVSSILSLWTKLDIKLAGKGADTIEFNEHEVKRMMKRCDYLEDLHVGIVGLFDKGVTIKSRDGRRLAGSEPMHVPRDKRYEVVLSGAAE